MTLKCVMFFVDALDRDPGTGREKKWSGRDGTSRKNFYQDGTGRDGSANGIVVNMLNMQSYLCLTSVYTRYTSIVTTTNLKQLFKSALCFFQREKAPKTSRLAMISEHVFRYLKN